MLATTALIALPLPVTGSCFHAQPATK